MANPAGLDDPKQKSTAFDMATITRYALLEHPSVLEYAGKDSEHSVYATEHNKHHWWFGHLSHMLSAYPGMIAAKTGYTDEAGTTYIGIAEKSGKRLVLVLMGSDGANANDDVKKILDYFSHVVLFSPIDIDIFFIPYLKAYNTNEELVTFYYQAKNFSNSSTPIY
jgi:D-alanyl-D-alanine carboxypeptidase (penicillin-binding protein 5/6)